MKGSAVEGDLKIQKPLEYKQTPPTIYETLYTTDKSEVKEYPLGMFQYSDRKENEFAWLHCTGKVNPADLKQFLSNFHIHELVMEDILSVSQSPKIEEYEHYTFFVGKIFLPQKKQLCVEQLSIIMGDNFLISFQTSCFQPILNIQQNIQENKNNIRNRGMDFLMYILIDKMVDEYFSVLSELNIKLEKMDTVLFQTQKENTLQKIHQLRRENIVLRTALLPVQESLNMILSGKITGFRKDSKIFIRDVADHIGHLISLLDSTRELVNSMMEVYLSFQSNKLNEQMRILTAITIIFMPLTLIAGIYGMNFVNMPELQWANGYYLVLGFMIFITVAMVWLFWKRKWF